MAEKKRTRSEIKRDAIVSAAKQAFVEFGVQGTSMDKLSELAQVSKRTVYNHFENKEVLVMHIMEEMWRKSTTSINIQYKADVPLHQQLKAILLAEATMIAAKENIDLSRVAFGHFFYNPEAMQKEMRKFSARETTLYKWLEAAISDRKIKQIDVDFANNQLHSMIKGHCFWPLLLGSCQDIEAESLDFISAETAAMFLSHYQV